MILSALAPVTGTSSLALTLALATPPTPQTRPLAAELAGLGVAAETTEGEGMPPAGRAGSPPRDEPRAAPTPTPTPPVSLVRVPVQDREFDRVSGDATPREAPREALDLGCGPGVPACERLTVFGTITAGVGGAGIAAGTVLLVTPTVPIDGTPTELRDFRRAGTTVMALSVSVVVTGLLMLWTAARASHRQARGHGTG